MESESLTFWNDEIYYQITRKVRYLRCRLSTVKSLLCISLQFTDIASFQEIHAITIGGKKYGIQGQ